MGWPFTPSLALGVLLLASGLIPLHGHGQAADDALSQREVDQLRDAAFVPIDRILVYERVLDDRQKQIDRLVATRKGHTDFPAEIHDLFDQFSAITDELNDNLDEYSRRRRDVRKALPKLIAATERWSTALRTPADDPAYTVVRRLALDNVKDTRELAQSLQTEQDAYFKAHPEAEKQEKERRGDPHAVQNDETPR